ncbi:MAG TPA: DUF1330 domain-containing protein [Gammaproteobacteria bacterium]
MAAYLVGTVSVRDPALWAEYVRGVAASLEPYAAEIVFRGRRAADLAGSQPRELAVVIRFAALAELHAWHASAAYQALVPLRDRAADVVITAYEA